MEPSPLKEITIITAFLQELSVDYAKVQTTANILA